ncbi:MAG: hypothetical protein AB7K24_34390 [Gemmataceae bacterium]
MKYRIEKIDLLVRETPPTRIALALGKQALSGKLPPRAPNALGYVRLILRNEQGKTAWGTSADQLAMRWLDKRPNLAAEEKNRALVRLLQQAREVYLQAPAFDSPFQKWHGDYQRIHEMGSAQKQEALTAQFCSALLERAMVDAVCRLEGQSLFQMVRQDRLGFRPAQVHPELKGLDLRAHLPEKPVSRFQLRHTIAQLDALTIEDVPADRRLNDGQPENLKDCIDAYGVRCFKILLSGNVERDLKRAARVWSLLPHDGDTLVTCDANEAYADWQTFADFAARLERDEPGLFQHLKYIEQPVPRALTLEPASERWVRKVGERVAIVIDEADDHLDVFKRAVALGYRGTANKNCKGFFKSLLNRALVVHFGTKGKQVLQTAEDLQNLPPVALHQDFVTLSILGIEQCQRNGYHYNHGLDMLSRRELPALLAAHADLYEKKGQHGHWRIRAGQVECGSLQCAGFGVCVEPDWESMTPIERWLK